MSIDSRRDETTARSRRRGMPRRFSLWSLWIVVLVVAVAVAMAGGPAYADEGAHVDVLRATGEINPVFAGYVQRGITQGERDGAAAVVIELDTPGGLDSSMRAIVQAIEGAGVPVIVYVDPPGARAASAGLFITEAAPIAAMAPDTNLGSAHPVGISPTGQTQAMDPVEAAKVTNDAVALIRGLAASHGRNADWVEQAVRQSENVGVDQAVALKVVDLKAKDLPDLLRQVDGRTVLLMRGPVTLHTANATADELPMTILDQLGQALADPTLAYIIMTLGVYALIYEVTHPGAIVPGVLGVVMLVIGLFALGTLSVSLAGLALVVFGFVLLAAEVIVVPGSGVLAAGGVGSLILGSLLLMNDAPPEERVAPWAVAAVVLVSAGFFAILGRGVLAVRRRQPRTGREGLIGASGVARTDLAPTGQILVQGEIWRAVAAPGFDAIPRGKPVFVVAIHGLTLTVAPSEVPAVR